jgi:hypothetical protein
VSKNKTSKLEEAGDKVLEFFLCLVRGRPDVSAEYYHLSSESKNIHSNNVLEAGQNLVVLLLGLRLDPENGGDIVLRNVGLSAEYRTV